MEKLERMRLESRSIPSFILARKSKTRFDSIRFLVIQYLAHAFLMEWSLVPLILFFCTKYNAMECRKKCLAKP